MSLIHGSLAHSIGMGMRPLQLAGDRRRVVNLATPTEYRNGHDDEYGDNLAFRGIRVRHAGCGTASFRRAHQVARSVVTHPGLSSGTRRSDGHARRVAPVSLAFRHFR